MIVFLLLPVHPESVGGNKDEDAVLSTGKEDEEVNEPLLRAYREDESAVGFIEAWRTPFALSLFSTKLVAYTFLYWLLYYISHTDEGYLSNEESGNLSTLFDVGGVVGGILAGYISDQLDARAIRAASFMYSVIPALYQYQNYRHTSMTISIILMLITGVFMNGPYALTTTVVSTDLGTQFFEGIGDLGQRCMTTTQHNLRLYSFKDGGETKRSVWWFNSWITLVIKFLYDLSRHSPV